MVALPNPGPFTEYAPTASRFKLESTASIELTRYPLASEQNGILEPMS